MDIVKKKLHTIDLDEGVASHREFDLEFSIGTTADVEGVEGKFVFGGEEFFFSFLGGGGGGRGRRGGGGGVLHVVKVLMMMMLMIENRKERIWSF